MLPWQPFDVVRCIFYIYILYILYKHACLVGVYARYTCSEVYVNIPWYSYSILPCIELVMDIMTITKLIEGIT